MRSLFLSQTTRVHAKKNTGKQSKLYTAYTELRYRQKINTVDSTTNQQTVICYLNGCIHSEP